MTIRTFTNTPGVVYDENKTDTIYAEDMNAIKDAIENAGPGGSTLICKVDDLDAFSTEPILVFTPPAGKQLFVFFAFLRPTELTNVSDQFWGQLLAGDSQDNIIMTSLGAGNTQVGWTSAFIYNFEESTTFFPITSDNPLYLFFNNSGFSGDVATYSLYVFGQLVDLPA